MGLRSAGVRPSALTSCPVAVRGCTIGSPTRPAPMNPRRTRISLPVPRIVISPLVDAEPLGHRILHWTLRLGCFRVIGVIAANRRESYSRNEEAFVPPDGRRPRHTKEPACTQQ